jgi:YbbR domain-containing protein
MRFLRWLGRNLSTLLLAFILSLIVWGSAVTAADPNQERVYQIPVEVIGQNTSIEVIGSIPDQMLITLFAPRSILDEIQENDNSTLRAWIDLSDVKPGTHDIPIQYQMPEGFSPVRVVGITPNIVTVTLELLIARTLPIQREILGEPALGYQTGSVEWSHQEVVVSGRSSFVDQVATVAISLDITGANESIEKTLNLVPRDSEGNLVPGVTLLPESISVNQEVTLRGGYRNMVVKVMTTGQVADGYRQTNITVSPPNVMIFSANPTLIDQLPGFIETEFLDLTGAADDIETVLALNLPEGISVIGDPNVLVQVGVAAIEDSIRITRNVEVIGILPELIATVSPETVEVIIFGPIPGLDALTEVDVRVVIDLTEMEPGVYRLKPDVVILPDLIRLQAISPETIEITIIEAEMTPTPAPTSTPSP